MIMTKFRRNQKGFTLLEIMLVVLIIGIIALLALPRLLITRKIAQQQTCLGDQSAIRTHLEAYKWEYGFYPLTGVEFTNFLHDELFWPVGHPAPVYCPGGDFGDYPWAYVAAAGYETPIVNEHGSGYEEYDLRCGNSAADPPHYLQLGYENPL